MIGNVALVCDFGWQRGTFTPDPIGILGNEWDETALPLARLYFAPIEDEL